MSSSIFLCACVCVCVTKKSSSSHIFHEAFNTKRRQSTPLSSDPALSLYTHLYIYESSCRSLSPALACNLIIVVKLKQLRLVKRLECCQGGSNVKYFPVCPWPNDLLIWTLLGTNVGVGVRVGVALSISHCGLMCRVSKYMMITIYFLSEVVLLNGCIPLFLYFFAAEQRQTDWKV